MGKDTSTPHPVSLRIAWAALHWRTLLAWIAWFCLGLFDFGSGFVSFSILRLVFLIVLGLLLLPLQIPAFLARSAAALSRHRGWSLVPLTILSLLGYSLFLSRYLHGASMGDDLVFQTVIKNTFDGCWLCYEGGSYFRFHNNLFLTFFAPLVALPAWWLIVHLLQSIAIILWCRICGWAIGRDSALGWLVTVALFLATWTQHATFYDTRFTALLLAVFAVGYYLSKKEVLWVGAFGALLTRETAALSLLMFGIVGSLRKKMLWSMIPLIALGLIWYFGTFAAMRWSGGPESTPRFPDCLKTADGLPSFQCLTSSVMNDWELKLAYTLRLARFAPSLAAIPSVIAALPDLGLTWVSKDDVLYNLSWHYYMQTLGTLIVGASLGAHAFRDQNYSNNLSARWILSSCIWQFVTTMRLNLF
jgi:hypothetical protein